MRRKSFRQRPRLLLLHRLQLLKESHKRLRIVSRFIHVLQTKVVRFRLKPALEAKEGHRQSQPSHLISSVTDAAAHENQRDGRKICILRASQLPRSMACANMRNLMSHYPSQFGFAVSRKNGSRININKPARKRHRLHHIRVNDLESKRHLRIRVAHQILPQPVHILSNDGIRNKLRSRIHHLTILLSHLDVAFDGIPVSEAASAYFAVADCVDVIFAAVVFHFVGIGRLNRGSLRALAGGAVLRWCAA